MNYQNHAGGSDKLPRRLLRRNVAKPGLDPAKDYFGDSSILASSATVEMNSPSSTGLDR